MGTVTRVVILALVTLTGATATFFAQTAAQDLAALALAIGGGALATVFRRRIFGFYGELLELISQSGAARRRRRQEQAETSLPNSSTWGWDSWDTVREPRPGARLHVWLDSMGFFIPKGIREPWWNHILEDRDRAVREKKGPLFIRLFIASQFLLLIACATKGLIGELLNGQAKTPSK